MEKLTHGRLIIDQLPFAISHIVNPFNTLENSLLSLAKHTLVLLSVDQNQTLVAQSLPRTTYSNMWIIEQSPPS